MYDFREEARLDALYQLKLLDTPASESFDRITRMASQIFDLPVAAVSLTDRDRQWFKSRVGVEHDSIPRNKAPCSAVAESTRPLVIEDFLTHPFYTDSVLARAGMRFYAGAPLITRDGYGLGALCVLSTKPRTATEAEMAALVDLAAMVMAQIELQHAFGRIDPVSGMPTRNQLREDLIDLARDHPGERRFAVVADLARDDQVNTLARALGGARADDMVREASRAVQAVMGASRTVYHIGPVQFAFLSPPGVDQAAYLDELRSTIQTLRTSSSMRFVTSVAIGVRPFTLGVETDDDVVRGATSAAQDARSVEGTIALYSVASDTAHRRRYRLLHDFGAALEAEDQLRLVFQPRIDFATGRCVGAETLLRWRHPTMGEISPAEFVPIVEQTSYVRPATQWVLDHALDQLSAWSRAGMELSLSLNISAANLAEADLIQRIQLALLKRQVRPEQLEIELTESAIMDRPDRAIAMLHELAATGVRLAIDDFGTGHSSLAYLQRLPARVVKIDQSFARELEQGASSSFVLVEAMVHLAHKLGFRVVVEGVETPEAAAAIARIGCDEAQGYFYARPMEPAQFGRWLRAREQGGRTSAAA